MKKVVAIIQARMGSTRLPGKVLMNLAGKPVLSHMMERVRQANTLSSVVIATSEGESDDPIAAFCRENGIDCFRGSELDVLARYYGAAKKNWADVYVRMTADCPLIDPQIIDATVEYFLGNSFRYVSQGGSIKYQCNTFPRGLDCEVFSAELLEEAYYQAVEPYEHEHVTPYMYWKQPSVSYFENPDYETNPEVSKQRWTLDTPEDYALIKAVYEALYHGEHNFYWKDILRFLNAHPEVVALNIGIQQKATK